MLSFVCARRSSDIKSVSWWILRSKKGQSFETVIVNSLNKCNTKAFCSLFVEFCLQWSHVRIWVCEIAVNTRSYHFKFHELEENNTDNDQLHPSFSPLLNGIKLSSFAVLLTFIISFNNDQIFGYGLFFTFNQTLIACSTYYSSGESQ